MSRLEYGRTSSLSLIFCLMSQSAMSRTFCSSFSSCCFATQPVIDKKYQSAIASLSATRKHVYGWSIKVRTGCGPDGSLWVLLPLEQESLQRCSRAYESKQRPVGIYCRSRGSRIGGGTTHKVPSGMISPNFLLSLATSSLLSGPNSAASSCPASATLEE